MKNLSDRNPTSDVSSMKSYLFGVILEPDEDRWRAYVPDWEAQGAATWGGTRDEALKNIQEVMQMLLEEMIEDGDPIPETVTVLDRPVIAVCA